MRVVKYLLKLLIIITIIVFCDLFFSSTTKCIINGCSGDTFCIVDQSFCYMDEDIILYILIFIIVDMMIGINLSIVFLLPIIGTVIGDIIEDIYFPEGLPHSEFPKIREFIHSPSLTKEYWEWIIIAYFGNIVLLIIVIILSRLIKSTQKKVYSFFNPEKGDKKEIGERVK